ncbi:MAG: hypothetical protein GXY03_10915 [Solirubrobacterales bacterium]|nr:hypothetical protein [Solirubrobacterales bacterium]
MLRNTRTRVRLALLALVAVASFAVPSSAMAAVSDGSVAHNQYSSWISYLYAFGGSASASSPAVYDDQGDSDRTNDVVTFGFTSTDTDYTIANPFAGSGTVAFEGDLFYDNASHYIDVDISDPQVEIPSTGSSAAKLTAVVSYDPLEVPGPQVANPTTPTRIDLYDLDLSGTFTPGASVHSWADVPAELTADGAFAFSGGGHGGYSAGQPFGTLDITAEN